MKKTRLLSMLCGLAAMFFIGMSFTSSEMDIEQFYGKDFRISNIRTPGGLCYGASENKVTVTVTNHGSSAYRQDIPVRLTISQKGYKTKRYIGKVRRGFSGRSTYGKTVTFNNVYIKNGEEVTILAEVNYDKSVSETAYGNNDRRIKLRPKGKCGQQQTAQVSGKLLTVGVYQGSTSNPMQGLQVVMTRKGSSQRVSFTTNNQGITSLQNIPRGRWRLLVMQGTATWEDRYYNMPSYNARLNIIL